MGTHAEDLERVRQLYRAIKDPWKRPRFPDPPKEFLPPETFLDMAKEAVLLHHTKINHPFCVKLFRGEWSVKQLHGWVKQEYHAVMQTLRNDANIVANAGTLEEIRDQLSVLIEEAGEDICGGKYPAHPELFVRMGEGLGLSRQEIISSEPSALMQLIIDEERYRGLRLTIGGLPSNLRLGERINALVFPVWAEVLRDKYHVADKALDFYHAHAVDEEHGKVGERVVLSRATTKEAQSDIWLRLKKGQQKQWINYDAYNEAAELAGEES